MYWYNKRHWSYFSHAYFAQRKKPWPFTLLTAVVSTLGSVAPTGRPRCACWVCWSCIIMVSPRGRILVSECHIFHHYDSNSKSGPVKGREGEKRKPERGKKVATLAFVKLPKLQIELRSRGLLQFQPWPCLLKSKVHWEQGSLLKSKNMQDNSLNIFCCLGVEISNLGVLYTVEQHYSQWNPKQSYTFKTH